MPLFQSSLLPALVYAVIVGTITTVDAGAAGDIHLIGGGPRTPEIIRRIGHAAGGSGAKIVVTPWATREPKAAVDLLRSQFAMFTPKSVKSAPFFPDEFDPGTRDSCLGLVAAYRPIEIFGAVEKRKFLADLADATLLYFTGGSQNRIMKVLSEDPEIAEAIRRFRERGGAYAGTSAGTAVVPTRMMSGKTAKLADDTEIALLTPGMGLLPPGIHVDQHFVQRGRFNRLRNLVVEDPSSIGIGISESTMAVIKDDGILEVVGDSQVIIYYYDPKDPVGQVREIWLSRGAHFDLTSRKLVKESAPKVRR